MRRCCVVLTSAGGLLLLPAGPASAACAAPTIAVEPAAAAVGQTVTVSGRGWATDCFDQGQTEKAPPHTGIVLSFASAPEVLLSRVDAGPDYTFRTRVVVPAGVPAGPTGLVVSLPTTPFGTAHVAAVPFAVVSTEAPGPTELPEPAELPRTAAPVQPIAFAALLCLLLGAAALRGGRLPPEAGPSA